MLGAAAILSASRVSRAQQAGGAQRITKLALPEFNAASGEDADLARQVTGLVSDDLRGSGRFTVIDASPPPTVEIDSVPRFDAWRILGVDSLVIGGLATVADGRLRCGFRLWDIAAGLQLHGAQYFTTPDHWRQLAHVIAGTVYERLVGEARDFEVQRD
jgi:TolB protein